MIPMPVSRTTDRPRAGPRARSRSLLARGFLAWPLLGALLGGCAGAPRVGREPPGLQAGAPVAQPASTASRPTGPCPAPSELSPGGVAFGAGDAPLGMGAIASMLRQVSGMSQAAAAARQRELQAPGARRGPGQRLELAYLLIARPAPTLDEAARAHDLLKGLDSQTDDAASRQFIRVLQRLSLQTVDLAQSRSDLAKSQRKVADLQDKIGQIKSLEVQLQGRTQDRGSPPPTPPKPAKPAAKPAPRSPS